ncbi:retrovirus-related pol polyprotein from transposon TNT 1-94 [Tanacetum coccineum]
MDVKSSFLDGKIKEEVYICQPPGFEDSDFLDRVYKVKKALYRLHQALRAWYETFSTYLLDNGFQRVKIDKTLFIKRHKGDILLVQVYVDDIIFGSTKKELCNAFKKFTEVKTTSTPMETQKPLLKDEDGKEVDVHMYRSMIGSLMYLTSSRPDIMFVVCACARYQVNPKVSHHAVKRIFRYLKGQPKLGLWYPKDFPFDLVAYTDSDYAGASLDMKSTIGGKAKQSVKLMIEKMRLSAVHKELGDSLVRAATTASSIEAEQDSDEEITLVSVQDDADKEMFDGDALNGEEVFVAGQNENVFEEVVDTDQVSTAATTVTITTKEITLAQALEALKTSKPKVKRIFFQEPGKSTTTTTISSQQSQDKGKGIMIEEPMKPIKKEDIIRLDEEVALNLQAKFD